MDAKLTNYLINLHEQSLISFDKAIEHYYWGYEYIDTTMDFTFHPKKYTSKFVKVVFYIGYIAFFSLAFVTFSELILVFKHKSLNIFIGASSIILGLSCLMKAENKSEALKFLALMHKAELQKSQSTSAEEN